MKIAIIGSRTIDYINISQYITKNCQVKLDLKVSLKNFVIY